MGSRTVTVGQFVCCVFCFFCAFVLVGGGKVACLGKEGPVDLQQTITTTHFRGDLISDPNASLRNT